MNRKDVFKHVSELQDEYNILSKRSDNTSIARTNIYRNRLAKFVYLATINVGGITKPEMVERKDRIDDAVHAIAASVEGGVVPGAGRVLFSVIESFKVDKIGVIMRDFCRAPLKVLLKNLLKKERDDVIAIMEEDHNNVYDITKGVFTTYSEASIYDPAYVLIKSIQSTISVLRIILKSNSMVINEEPYV